MTASGGTSLAMHQWVPPNTGKLNESTTAALYCQLGQRFFTAATTKIQTTHKSNPMKSQRIAVKPHNIEFLKSLAAQMGVTDLSEVLNYLLLDVKGLAYRYGDKSVSKPQQAPIGYTFEPSVAPIQECDRNEFKVDPMIQRLLDAGLDMEF